VKLIAVGSQATLSKLGGGYEIELAGERPLESYLKEAANFNPNLDEEVFPMQSTDFHIRLRIMYVLADDW
jgi:hypothetical protein